MKAAVSQASSSTDAAGFSAPWLQQREPFDAVARSKAASRLGLAARLTAWRPGHSEPWRIIDLACGTGSNLRWLAPRLGGQQQWLVVDHDLVLLQSWPADSGSVGAAYSIKGPAFEADIVRQQIDLASSLHRLPWAAAHLVSASALLDLVSATWLQKLAQQAAKAQVALLMALSVDGRHQWSVTDPLDDTVARLFAAHQQRDKGFAGPALGAAAAPALAQALRAVGYRVFSARSDWRLDGSADPQARALQRALIDGISAAACDQQPGTAAAVRGWQQRRQALAARSTLVVGHVDLLALPSG